ncbi:MAG: hypothetical protein LBT59_30640 [Clostridiales bacterium]|jgi:hypothetical protein|nr:hypothetical protein [Clostridiales bacterium]
MRKVDALRLIHDCAIVYSNTLANRSFVFTGIANGQAIRPEVLFRPQSFMHLAGVKADSFTGRTFFDAIISNRLGVDDFSLVENGTAELKLRAMLFLIDILSRARMLGFSNNDLVVADKLAKSECSAVRFIKVKDHYEPCETIRGNLSRVFPELSRYRVVEVSAKKAYDGESEEIFYIDAQRCPLG